MAVRVWISFFSFSTSAPLRPMMMPGRAVKMVIRARLAERSMSIREMPAWYSEDLMKRRILTSSCSSPA